MSQVWDLDQVIIETGGTLDVSYSTLNVLDGPGVDISSAGQLIIDQQISIVSVKRLWLNLAS